MEYDFIMDLHELRLGVMEWIVWLRQGQGGGACDVVTNLRVP